MATPVHILATCRKPELLPWTTLVFETLRVGFPTADVTVHINAMDDTSRGKVVDAATARGCAVLGVDTIHHEWIGGLLASATAPFYLLDTDVIFWSSCEAWGFDTGLAGRRIPEWHDAFSGCITRARLHTSLLYVDPVIVRAAVATYESRIADTPFTPRINLINPITLPFKRRAYFYDTCALLYHAIGGTPFSERQLNAYDHFNFGTIPDVVLPRLGQEGVAMAALRDLTIANPSSARGMWRAQNAYYAFHPA